MLQRDDIKSALLQLLGWKWQRILASERNSTLDLLNCGLQAASASRSKNAETSVLPGEFSLDSVASSLKATGTDIHELASEAIEDTKAAVQNAAEQAAFKAQLIQRREARARCAASLMLSPHKAQSLA